MLSIGGQRPRGGHVPGPCPRTTRNFGSGIDGKRSVSTYDMAGFGKLHAGQFVARLPAG